MSDKEPTKPTYSVYSYLVDEGQIVQDSRRFEMGPWESKTHAEFVASVHIRNAQALDPEAGDHVCYVAERNSDE